MPALTSRIDTRSDEYRANAASLQRGARMYMNYCSGCHSLQYVRYSRVAEDLGLTEEQAMRNLNFTGAKFGETIQAAMPAADATQFFGKAPPDLSLVARSRGVNSAADNARNCPMTCS